MLQYVFDNTPWFEPKRIGYGSGWPIAWQGWVLLGAHIAAILGVAMWLRDNQIPLVLAGIVVAILPLPIYARHTRGGWRWRNGARD